MFELFSSSLLTDAFLTGLWWWMAKWRPRRATLDRLTPRKMNSRSLPSLDSVGMQFDTLTTEGTISEEHAFPWLKQLMADLSFLSILDEGGDVSYAVGVQTITVVHCFRVWGCFCANRHAWIETLVLESQSSSGTIFGKPG